MNDDRAVRMDDLLAHRQWVRSLARRLAADEARADDLEQETWLAAVEHPPRDPRSVRGWLGTVLRNLHRNSLRGDVRRERREAAPRLREPEPGAPEIVAEAETQHLLVSEVLALDEPYRSTVLLRWYEDLTPTEIAARQGVPVDTVKTRLRRAVDRLRERMDARFDGDRRAWCLLALGGGDGSGVGTGTGTVGGTKAALTGAAGGMAMGLATKLTIAAAVLVAAGAFWWSRSDGGAPPPADGGETASAAPPAAPKRDHRASVAGDSKPTTASTADPAAPDRDLDLHGVVARADGTPVVGAKVQAVDYPWRRAQFVNFRGMFESHPGAETTTADAGAFRMRLRRGASTILRVSADGLATRDMGPYQAGQSVRITLTAAVKLRVNVRDEAGTPVASAALWLVGFGRGEEPWIDARATTDSAGECEFDGLPGGAKAAIMPLSGSGDFGQERLTLPLSGKTTVDIVSPAGRMLRGRVFDAVTLSPVTGASVGAGIAQTCAVMTDGGGRFEIRGWTGKSAKDLHVTASGYGRACVPVGADGPIEIALRRGFAATGRVVGADGAPVAGAFVGLAASSRNGASQQVSTGSAVADAEGRFRVEDLDRAAIHALSAFAPGRGRIQRTVAPPRDGVDVMDVGDVLLPAARAIEGVVLRPDGTPSAGVDVRLAGPGAPSGGLGGGEDRRTDDLGRFRYSDLGPGDYVVEARIPGASPLTANVTLTADRDVTDVVLPPKHAGDAIAVQVVDDAGTPIPHTIVLGYGSQHDELCRVETDDAGRARLRRPSKGKLARLLVGAPIPGPWLISSEVPIDPNVAEQRLVVERGAYVPVQVLDADGRPLVGARLHVEPPERGTVWSGTDGDGRTQAIVAREGEVSIVFSGTVFHGLGDKFKMEDALLEARQDGVTARSGEIVLRCRRVATGRSATVRVLAADGSPMEGIDVFVAGGGANFFRQSKTDAEGRARFEDLPGRELQSCPFGRPDTLFPGATKFVPSGQEVVLRCPEAIAVRGTAVWSSGEAVAGALAEASWGGSTTYLTRTDRDGRFAVQVPAGESGPFRLKFESFDGKTSLTAERDFTSTEHELRVELKR